MCHRYLKRVINNIQNSIPIAKPTPRYIGVLDLQSNSIAVILTPFNVSGVAHAYRPGCNQVLVSDRIHFLKGSMLHVHWNGLLLRSNSVDREVLALETNQGGIDVIWFWAAERYRRKDKPWSPAIDSRPLPSTLRLCRFGYASAMSTPIDFIKL